MAGWAAVVGSWMGLAQAQMASVPAKVDEGRGRAQVLVLGTAHLSQLTPSVTDAALAPVIERLSRFKPDIIAVEDLPAESCDIAARYPAIYDQQEFAAYCPNVDIAKRSTGLDVPAALTELHRQLGRWPAAPTPAERRKLIATAMAAGETATAALQWQQLAAAERREGDGIDAALAAQLKKLADQGGEVSRLAVPVAQRLSLNRLYAIDDHSGDNVQVADVAAFGQAVQRAWDGARASRQVVQDRQAALLAEQDGLALYRHLNDPAVLKVALDSDFGAAAAEPSPEKFGRIYVGGWETRNLRMAANLRATFRERPDARVLLIVGSSHKPILDRLLGSLEGIDIVDAQQVLR